MEVYSARLYLSLST